MDTTETVITMDTLENVPTLGDELLNTFFVCNGVVAIRKIHLEYFPKITAQLATAKIVNTLFISVKPKKLSLTQFNFDEFTVNGYIGLDQVGDINIIEEIFKINDVAVLTNSLNVVVKVFPNNLLLKITNFDKDLIERIKIFASIGFYESNIDMDNTLVLRYRRPVNITETIMQALKNIEAITTNKSTLVVLFSHTLATTLGEYGNLPHEVGGKLLISSYNSKGQAILSFNKSYLIHGRDDDTFTTSVPDAALSFHTHPKRLYEKLNLFTAWPSGPDMGEVVNSFLTGNNILAHFVVTNEGIWVVHVTYNFQKLLIHFRNTLSLACKKNLIYKINNEFTTLEVNRHCHLVTPDKRCSVVKEFETVATSYTIFDLVKQLPECPVPTISNSLLFDTKLITWDQFQNGVEMKFDYVPDEEGNLPAYLPLDNLADCADTIS